MLRHFRYPSQGIGWHLFSLPAKIALDQVVNGFCLFLVDNVSGRKVPGRKGVNHDFSLFTASDEDKRMRISPQLAFALFQYLSTGKD